MNASAPPAPGPRTAARPRIGVDVSKLAEAADLRPPAVLRRIAELGLDGAFFRSALDLSPTLDSGELRDVVALAAELGLYLEVGTAKVNPFATPEAPHIRALGDGDYLRGLARVIRACASADIRELWTATANYQFHIPGIYACDRFRTDVAWSDQLAATAGVLRSLAPVLRDAGAHLNLETHEEITTFEVVRLVEDAGPDAFGICLDTANVLVRGEDPVEAARRVAPYVRQTQLRDAALLPTENGIGRFLAPCGEGVVDWAGVLGVLVTHAPLATWSIEGVVGRRGEMTLYVDEPVWHAAHPDLTTAELAELNRLTHAYAQRAARGQAPGLEELRSPVTPDASLDFITDSAAYLRTLVPGLEPSTASTAIPMEAAL
ncbi:sugar phosphate isomerase/epimerase family protein [Uniformispora flossi]|uniref:sugar phosphate isomerase/epimerase family protein n=1 Tax=Uniformispora flossi TaxID=3390723 RepID=UPI003C2D6F63